MSTTLKSITLTAYLCFYNECLLTHNQKLPRQGSEQKKHIAGRTISRLSGTPFIILIAVAVNVRCGSHDESLMKAMTIRFQVIDTIVEWIDINLNRRYVLMILPVMRGIQVAPAAFLCGTRGRSGAPCVNGS